MSKAIAILFAGVVSIFAVQSATVAAQQTQPIGKAVNDTPASGGVELVVSLADRRMAVIEDGAVKRIYRVAVGKPSTPSPTGSFRVVSRVSNPTYYHQGRVVAPGPGNPVGTRWIGLSEKGYGIHGTNAPGSIGKAASHGCIRMDRRDLEELFAMLKTGETVEIVAEPNAETAILFGNGDSGNGNHAAPAGAALAQASVPVTTEAVVATAMVGQ